MSIPARPAVGQPAAQAAQALPVGQDSLAPVAQAAPLLCLESMVAATGATNTNFEKSNPGLPGVAGYAIRKNGKTVSVTNNGTISGTVG